MRGRVLVFGLVLVAAWVMVAVPAFAETVPLYPSPSAPEVLAPQSVPAPAALAPQPVAQVHQGGLPVTGGDVVGLTIIGAAAIAGGLTLTRVRGSRRSLR